MSGLTKKTVYADKVLATLLGVKEGAHVSYAELSKGLHQYIRENNLRKPNAQTESTSTPTLLQPSAGLGSALPAYTGTQVTMTSSRKCRDCGVEIPIDAVFCDLCGMRQ